MENTIKTMGRPKLARRKIQLPFRLYPELIPAVRDLVEGRIVKKNDLTQQLLNHNESLEAKVADMQSRLERCAAASDDDKVRYWRNRAVTAEKKLSTDDCVQ